MGTRITDLWHYHGNFQSKTLASHAQEPSDRNNCPEVSLLCLKGKQLLSKITFV